MSLSSKAVNYAKLQKTDRLKKLKVIFFKCNATERDKQKLDDHSYCRTKFNKILTAELINTI